MTANTSEPQMTLTWGHDTYRKRIDYSAGMVYDRYSLGYAHIGDAGVDLRSTEEFELPAGTVRKVSLGISVDIPKGFFGLLCPRSGLAGQGLGFVNGVGVIDSGYIGDICAVLYNYSKKPIFIHEGMRIAQLIIIPYVTWTNLECRDTEYIRGTDGFGSSGVD